MKLLKKSKAKVKLLNYELMYLVLQNKSEIICYTLEYKEVSVDIFLFVIVICRLFSFVTTIPAYCHYITIYLAIKRHEKEV